MARKGFVAYHSYLKTMEPLSDAECGRLFRACLTYSMTGTIPSLCGNERILWPTIQEQIDRDTKKYGDFCEKQRDNINKRWKKDDTTVYHGTSGIPDDTKNTKTNANANENANKGVHPPKSPQGGLDGRFARFWEAYPKKVGKGAAETAWRKRKPDDALLSQMLQAIERAKQSPDWTKDGGQYIPNPATWLNQRRWEDEIGPVGEFDNLQRLYEMFREEG